MKITKFVHSCLLVEMPAPVNRTALFDPGNFSEAALNIESLEFLDDIVITHLHPDHISLPLIKGLITKFPDVRITAPDDALEQLSAAGITASSQPPDGIAFFDAPHESVEPLFPTPQQRGVHYLDLLTNPGDSHSFSETKAILMLPISGPWASMIKALNLAIALRPQYVLPIHDWHLSDAAREQVYDRLAEALNKEGITFVPLETGIPVVIDAEDNDE